MAWVKKLTRRSSPWRITNKPQANIDLERRAEHCPPFFSAMKLNDLLKNSEAHFRAAGFDSPEIEAAYMLEEVTGIKQMRFMIISSFS